MDSQLVRSLFPGRKGQGTKAVGILVLLLLVDDLNPVFILLGGGRIAHCREVAIHCVMLGGRGARALIVSKQKDEV